MKQSKRHSTSQTPQESPTSPDGSDEQPSASRTNVSPTKPKRVRTGCLTCRSRHLKCDEATPICMNCKKSNRPCKRGIKLNFLENTCQRPPHLLSPTHDWQVEFQDESRDIASEYVGGFERYTALRRHENRHKMEVAHDLGYDYPTQMGAPVMQHQQLPPTTVNGMYQTYAEASQAMYVHASGTNYTQPAALYDQSPVQPSYDQTLPMEPEPEMDHPYLQERDEVLYMQVFVEEVGLWMDSMDAEKHFSRLLPVQALRQPMLKYAILACGVRHLTLVNSSFPQTQAIDYYNRATQALLKSLQNPDRDSVLCATTATILNVYEIMSETALARMNHIAGARALIKECRWDATATGIGSACFWFNVGLELFSCLHFNWGVAWDPETWNLDMTMQPQQFGGNEEEWCHKILYILAKTTNFRSSAPKFLQPQGQQADMKVYSRRQTWNLLKSYCDKWVACVPPTMHPLAFVPPYLTRSKSSFPEVWLIKRATIVARLFYHTALVLLGAFHPMAPYDPQIAREADELKVFHSRQICGIVAHVKDRGVASASVRCLATAGEHLSVRREQDEVIEIFERIKKEAGWRVGFIIDDLREKWGWNSSVGSPNDAASVAGSAGSAVGGYDANGNSVAAAAANNSSSASFFQASSSSTAAAAAGGSSAMPPPPPGGVAAATKTGTSTSASTARGRPQFPSGIVNPMYKNADFLGPNHPYQGNYVAPNHAGTAHLQGLGMMGHVHHQQGQMHQQQHQQMGPMGGGHGQLGGQTGYAPTGVQGQDVQQQHHYGAHGGFAAYAGMAAGM